MHYFRCRKSKSEPINEEFEMNAEPEKNASVEDGHRMSNSISTQRLILDGIEKDSATYVNVSPQKGYYKKIENDEGRLAAKYSI